MADEYFLVKEVLAVDTASTQALTIPQGETIEFIATRPPDNRFVSVGWHGKKLMMLQQDLLRYSSHRAA